MLRLHEEGANREVDKAGRDMTGYLQLYVSIRPIVFQSIFWMESRYEIVNRSVKASVIRHEMIFLFACVSVCVRSWQAGSVVSNFSTISNRTILNLTCLINSQYNYLPWPFIRHWTLKRA